jgi:hypothetical protein
MVIQTSERRIETQIKNYVLLLEDVVTKEMALNGIKKTLIQAQKDKTSVYQLFYSGHGHPDCGAWVVHTSGPTADFSLQQIMFEELWDVIY